MPNMRKKAQQMMTMLLMGLREERRVSTTSFSPGARFITRRGLRALRVLMVLKAWMPPAPSRDAVKLMSDT